MMQQTIQVSLQLKHQLNLEQYKKRCVHMQTTHTLRDLLQEFDLCNCRGWLADFYKTFFFFFSFLMLKFEDLRTSCQVGKLGVKWERQGQSDTVNMSWNLWGWTRTHVSLSLLPDHIGLLWESHRGKLVLFVMELNIRMLQKLVML